MKIVADRGIPFVRQCFAGLGELVLADGRAIDGRLIQDADVLVTRTVTRVDRRLLQDTQVRFVASPTSGVDHVDLDYLAAAGIGFAHAPGCNARAVAEYLLSALFALVENEGRSLAGLRAGVIGCGAVGGLVASFLEAIGIECLRNDPPLGAAGAGGAWRELAELQDVDILTLHVPLTDAGPYATCGLLNESMLSRLKPDVVIVNTSRGEVVHEPALCRFLARCRNASAVLDVWAGEPQIDPQIHSLAKLGTPHIAGYSADARLRATLAISRSVRRFLGRDADAVQPPPLPPPPIAEFSIAAGTPDLEAIQMAVLASYDVRSDAAQLRRIGDLDRHARGEYFSALRDGYAMRREFSAHTVKVPANMAAAAHVLGELGFTVKSGD